MYLLKFKPLFRPVETKGWGEGGEGGVQPPHILNKVDLLPIANNSEKKKRVKKI